MIERSCFIASFEVGLCMASPSATPRHCARPTWMAGSEFKGFHGVDLDDAQLLCPLTKDVIWIGSPAKVGAVLPLKEAVGIFLGEANQSLGLKRTALRRIIAYGCRSSPDTDPFFRQARVEIRECDEKPLRPVSGGNRPPRGPRSQDRDLSPSCFRLPPSSRF